MVTIEYARIKNKVKNTVFSLPIEMVKRVTLFPCLYDFCLRAEKNLSKVVCSIRYSVKVHRDQRRCGSAWCWVHWRMPLQAALSQEMFLSVAPKKIGQTAFGFNFCFLCLTTLRTLKMVQELREGIWHILLKGQIRSKQNALAFVHIYYVGSESWLSELEGRGEIEIYMLGPWRSGTVPWLWK